MTQDFRMKSIWCLMKFYCLPARHFTVLCYVDLRYLQSLHSLTGSFVIRRLNELCHLGMVRAKSYWFNISKVRLV